MKYLILIFTLSFYFFQTTSCLDSPKDSKQEKNFKKNQSNKKEESLLFYFRIALKQIKIEGIDGRQLLHGKKFSLYPLNDDFYEKKKTLYELQLSAFLYKKIKTPFLENLFEENTYLVEYFYSAEDPKKSFSLYQVFTEKEVLNLVDSKNIFVEFIPASQMIFFDMTVKDIWEQMKIAIPYTEDSLSGYQQIITNQLLNSQAVFYDSKYPTFSLKNDTYFPLKKFNHPVKRSSDFTNDTTIFERKTILRTNTAGDPTASDRSIKPSRKSSKNSYPRIIKR